MIKWEQQKIDGMMIYFGKDDYSTYEIRSWPYDESGDGKFQLCKNGYHEGNFKTLREAKQFADVEY